MIKFDKSYPLLPPIYALTFPGGNTKDLNILSLQAMINVKAQELKGSISIFQIHSFIEENWTDWVNSGLHNDKDKSRSTQINGYISRFFDHIDNPSTMIISEGVLLAADSKSSAFPDQNIYDPHSVPDFPGKNINEPHSVPEYNSVELFYNYSFCRIRPAPCSIYPIF